MKANPFLGAWRIVEMELWDSDYLDLVGPAHMTLGAERMGTFQFGTVRGWIHYHVGERDGRPAVEFSWEGENDADPACGRGWATLEADRLEGRLFIHRGDDSAFTATRTERIPSSGAALPASLSFCFAKAFLSRTMMTTTLRRSSLAPGDA